MECTIEQAKRIEELRGGDYVNDKPFIVPLKIAVMTYDDSKTLSACLSKLMHQGIIPYIEIWDRGSKDGTPEMIATQIKNDIYFPAVVTLKTDKIDLKKHEAKAFYREKTIEDCKVKYIMFLNPNVMLPNYCIRPMLEELEKDPTLAMVGLRYDPMAYHIQFGASILRVDVAKELNWKLGNQCACRDLRDQLIIKGYKIKQMDEIALHFTGLL